jgi:hypothetical protein
MDRLKTKKSFTFIVVWGVINNSNSHEVYSSVTGLGRTLSYSVGNYASVNMVKG